MEYFQGAYLSENTIRFGIFNNPNLVFKTYSSNNNIKKNTGNWKKKKRQKSKPCRSMKWVPIIPASRMRMRERQRERKKEEGDERWREALSKLERVSSARLSFSAFLLLSSPAWEAVWIESNNIDWLSLDEWLSNDTGFSVSFTPSLCTYLT